MQLESALDRRTFFPARAMQFFVGESATYTEEETSGTRIQVSLASAISALLLTLT
jgi:hypothetical protein